MEIARSPKPSERSSKTSFAAMSWAPGTAKSQNPRASMPGQEVPRTPESRIGFRVSGLRFKVGFKVWGLGFKVFPRF